MKRPSMTEYDGWRESAITKWYFQYVQEQADLLAADNGRGPGNGESYDYDHMKTVRNAGFILGLEEAINHDPFIEDRDPEEGLHEDTSGR